MEEQKDTRVTEDEWVAGVKDRLALIADDPVKLRELANPDCKDCHGTGIYGRKLTGHGTIKGVRAVNILCHCMMKNWAERDARMSVGKIERGPTTDHQEDKNDE